MKKEEMSVMDYLAEAFGILGLLFYLGFQIYYGIQYGVAVERIGQRAHHAVGVCAFDGIAVFPGKDKCVAERALCWGDKALYHRDAAHDKIDFYVVPAVYECL